MRYQRVLTVNSTNFPRGTRGGVFILSAVASNPHLVCSLGERNLERVGSFLNLFHVYIYEDIYIIITITIHYYIDGICWMILGTNAEIRFYGVPVLIFLMDSRYPHPKTYNNKQWTWKSVKTYRWNHERHKTYIIYIYHGYCPVCYLALPLNLSIFFSIHLAHVMWMMYGTGIADIKK